MQEVLVPDHIHTFGERLQLAVQAAHAAGRILRNGYGQICSIEQKGVGDLVSQIDLDADQAASEILRAGSDWPILSEELNSELEPQNEMWILDPLDGSSAYLMNAGRQYPAVLVAAREQGRTSLGVVHFPLTDEWFYAQLGRGAWHNGKRLVCDLTERLCEVWVEMNQYGDARLETPRFATLRSRLRSREGARLVTSNVPYSGVAARIAAGDSTLAAAVHDNNPSCVKQAPWDLAAPQLILEEAGGVFLNLEGNRTDPFVAEPTVVARSVDLAHRIIELSVRQSDYSHSPR